MSASKCAAFKQPASVQSCDTNRPCSSQSQQSRERNFAAALSRRFLLLFVHACSSRLVVANRSASARKLAVSRRLCDAMMMMINGGGARVFSLVRAVADCSDPFGHRRGSAPQKTANLCDNDEPRRSLESADRHTHERRRRVFRVPTLTLRAARARLCTIRFALRGRHNSGCSARLLARSLLLLVSLLACVRALAPRRRRQSPSSPHKTNRARRRRARAF